MPKAEKGSAKDVANKMKAKGLQKLKFYCQMCSKQCRDENGFKCHLTSESHLRQMKIFAENADGFMDSFSSEFEAAYMDTLRRRHGTKRMNANNVYQEVIQDKGHVHMNATKWATLSDFVQYLGKVGKCVVEETERGWYVAYIERDPALLARQEAHRRRLESERAEEEKAAKRMEKQRVEAAKAVAQAGGNVDVAEASKLDRSEDDKPVALAIDAGGLGGKKRKKGSGRNGGAKKIRSAFGDDDDASDEESAAAAPKAASPTASSFTAAAASAASAGPAPTAATTNPKPTVDLLVATATAACIHDADARRKCRDEDTYYRSKTSSSSKCDRSGKTGDIDRGSSSKETTRIEDMRKDYWIRRDLVVRIISKKLSGGKYYKRKGTIVRVIDRYMAEIEVLDSAPDAQDGGDLVRIDQDDLETVMPKEGKECRILNGRGRGKRAEVLRLDRVKYRGTLKILDSGEIVEKVHYEDFSKIAPR